MPHQKSPNKHLISVVIPVFNEARNVMPMCEALTETLARVPNCTYELIFVDDGSADETWEAVNRCAQNIAVSGIRFARNFGKEAALEAGLKAAKGDAVITIDGDLQHPPELVPQMLRAWQAGSPIVRMQHASASHAGIFKRTTSKLFYWLLNMVSDTPLQAGASDFCLLDKQVVNELIVLSEKQKFHRLLISWIGFPITTITYQARERQSGNTAYSVRRLFSLARHAIVSSSTLPMTLVFLIGCLVTFFGGVLTVGLLLYKLFVDFEYIGGAIIVAAFVIFNNGLLLIAIGLVSLYLVATYREVQNRPSFVVRERL